MKPTVETGAEDADARLARPVRDCTTMVFPTPVTVHPWPGSEALDAELAALVRRLEAAEPGLARSNVGGWHSGTDFIHRDEPCVRRLKARARALVGAATAAMMRAGEGRVAMEGWANLLRRGQYNGVHLHPNSTWSGVYYVTGNAKPGPGEGDPAFSGKIEFVDPRPGASATYSVESMMQRRCLIDPDAGTMILFPSWLQHMVHPYFGPGDRISIAFNALVT